MMTAPMKMRLTTPPPSTEYKEDRGEFPLWEIAPRPRQRQPRRCQKKARLKEGDLIDYWQANKEINIRA